MNAPSGPRTSARRPVTQRRRRRSCVGVVPWSGPVREVGEVAECVGLWEGMNGLTGEGEAVAETFADRGAGLGGCRRWFPAEMIDHAAAS